MPLADACVTEWRLRNTAHLMDSSRVPLADACVTEWRFVAFNEGVDTVSAVPLADACVTEWRTISCKTGRPFKRCHSLMLVLLNGGYTSGSHTLTLGMCHSLMLVLLNGGMCSERLPYFIPVPLADACVTEWR